jgi:hypothetical protein
LHNELFTAHENLKPIEKCISDTPIMVATKCLFKTI